MLAIGLTLSSVVLGISAALAPSNFQEQCFSRANSTLVDIPGSQLLLSQFVAANTTLVFPNADPSCGRPSQTVNVNLCRIVLNYPTSNASGFRMELWLPSNWTGRFLSTGNGGLGGCIQYEDMNYASSLGFATVGTNNGHDGMGGAAFLNHPGVIEDFAYRALHTGVVLGKKITKRFYGKAHKKSYYLGCSTGGRQGMKEAQSFPDDFDGIVAGAPAISFNNLSSWSSHFRPLVGMPGSATFVPVTMWNTIHADILKQCDGLDGAIDGILESPDLCNYDPADLICAAGATNTSNCLTATQAQTVRNIFLPLYDPDGSLVYPSMQYGSETTGALGNYYSGSEFFGSDWFKYVVFNNPNWTSYDLKPSDYGYTSHLNPFDISTFHGNLSGIQKRGTKLLHYHGLADGTISSNNSPRYYQHVSDAMKLNSSQLDEFYRFFRISGMGHCSGGPGASFIGNQQKSVASLHPDENVLMAMIRWVEKGVAPDTITGTAYVNGTQSAGVAFKRRHCRWPRRNLHNGTGPATDPDSWNCVL